MNGMDEILEILEEINDEVDYESCTDLVTGGYLTSFAILTLVSELEDAFDIEIAPVELVPANFDSAEAICKMVNRLMD